MIIADRKPLAEILDMIRDCDRILIIGCKGCVTVCNVGGAKEVGILASALKIARKKEGRPMEVDEKTIERQCDPEYIEQIKNEVNDYDAVISMACGVGPQFLSGAYPEQRFFPAVNTTSFGGAVQHGVWEERCAGCGQCVIHYFGGMCPIARCSKSLLNGPCGGSVGGKCEIDSEIDCAWQLIYDRLQALNKLELLMEIQPAKDWSTSRDGGPRKIVREDLRL